MSGPWIPIAAAALLTLMPGSASRADAPFWVEGADGPAPGRPDSFADLADALSPAVVFIEVRKSLDRAGPMLPRGDSASGSGFVLSSDGYIATNHHVVENATDIQVRLLDGVELPASVVGTDPLTDLALIRVESERALVPAPLGDSDATRVGEWVVAIGNPFGLDHSVTVGILSAKGRSIAQSQYDDFLQTDASINPGNSGGPLIDAAGRVIGINSAIKATGLGQTTGIGFAIPINLAKALLPQLKEAGVVTRGWLGVRIQRVTPPLARGFGSDEVRGALVSQLQPDSPAVGRLEVGDIVVEFNGTPIETDKDLVRRVAEVSPGTDVEMVVLRRSHAESVRTVLGRRPDDEIVADARGDEPEGGDEEPRPRDLQEDWGFEVEGLETSFLERFGFGSKERGVRVLKIEEDSPADRAEPSLSPGDIILEVNRQPVRTPGDLEELLEGEEVLLYVTRQDRSFFTTLQREVGP